MNNSNNGLGAIIILVFWIALVIAVVFLAIMAIMAIATAGAVFGSGIGSYNYFQAFRKNVKLEQP